MKMLTANVEYSVDDIAARLDMSRRTIYRYIDTFRDAGFVIKKSGQCIRLDKESPHFKDISQLVHFTEEEAVILRRAIESIDDTNTLKLNLKRKLYSVYDSKTLADTVVKGHNAGNIHSLIEAIESRSGSRPTTSMYGVTIPRTANARFSRPPASTASKFSTTYGSTNPNTRRASSIFSA